jgi:hypothetical protein
VNLYEVDSSSAVYTLQTRLQSAPAGDE